MPVRNAKRAVCALSTIAALSLASSVNPAVAPASPPYDINHAKLAWVYKAGVTPADGLNVKCGLTTGGPYTRITQVPITTLSLPLSSVVGVSGTWYCVVTDYVQTASGQLEGQGSNEISFFAAVAPSGSIAVSIIP